MKISCLFAIFALGLSLSQANQFGQVLPNTLQNPTRVVSIGDVHGDLSNFLEALKLAKLIELTDVPASPLPSVWGEPGPEWRNIQEARVSNVKWVGGNTVLVQTGDLVDRGVDTVAVYTLIRRLQQQASKVGGAVVPLLGNHELMNLRHQFQDGMYDNEFFGGKSMHDSENKKQAFSQNGFLGKWLRTLDTVAVIGRTMYSHAGVLSEWANGRTVAQINDDMRKAIDKKRSTKNISSYKLYEEEQAEKRMREKDPLWNRVYGVHFSKCPDLMNVLKEYGADRMVVGHTPQREGGIQKKCDDRLYLIDTALSDEMKRDVPNRISALEMVYGEDGVTVKVHQKDAIRKNAIRKDANEDESPKKRMKDEMPMEDRMDEDSVPPFSRLAPVAINRPASLGINRPAALAINRPTSLSINRPSFLAIPPVDVPSGPSRLPFQRPSISIPTETTSEPAPAPQLRSFRPPTLSIPTTNF